MTLLLLNKDVKAAEEWMTEATKLEKEAKQQFEKVLERTPKRRLAMMRLENTSS